MERGKRSFSFGPTQLKKLNQEGRGAVRFSLFSVPLQFARTTQRWQAYHPPLREERSRKLIPRRHPTQSSAFSTMVAHILVLDTTNVTGGV